MRWPYKKKTVYDRIKKKFLIYVSFLSDNLQINFADIIINNIEYAEMSE